MSSSKYEREYIHRSILGRGTYGTVNEVQNKHNKVVTAMKVIELKDTNETFMKYIEREIDILSKVKNPYIVEYRQSFIEGTQVYIEMELCPITLDQLIYQTKKEMKVESLSKKPMSYYVCCELFVQILKGVEYLHKKSIIHRDLKPTNILLKYEDVIQVKLADFGVSRIKDFDGQSMTAYTGTKGRMAPEMCYSNDILKITYDQKVDIWSLGHIIDDLFNINAIKDVSDNLKTKIKYLDNLKNCVFMREPQNRPECCSILQTINQWILSVEELETVDDIEKIANDNELKTSLKSNFVVFYLRQKLGLKSIGMLDTESLKDGVNLNDEINIFVDYAKFKNLYSQIKLIADGSYGRVYECKDISTNKISAIKITQLSYNDLSNPRMKWESEFMKQMNSEYIVKFYDSWIEKDERDLFLYISMELCLKTLKEFNEQLLMELNCRSICESSIGFYILYEVIRDVTEGLNYLHKNKIIHRDIKPQNILIVDKQNGIMTKIADFGISCIHEKRLVSNEFTAISHTGDVGDFKYMAPELQGFSGRMIYDEKVDIYSLGVIFKEIYNVELNAFNPLNDELKTKINALKDLILKMTSQYPERRPDTEKILRITNDLSMNIKEVFNTSDIEIKIKNKNKFESMHENFISYYMRIELKLIYNDLMALKRRRLSIDNDLMQRIKSLI